MERKKKKLLWIFFGGNAVLCVMAVLFFAVDRWTNGELFACYLQNSLHIYCGGCGFTRAVRALLHLDIISSLRYNASVLASVLVLGYYEYRFARSAFRGDFEFFRRSRAFPAIALAVFVLALFLFRNILLHGFGIDMIGDFSK